MTETETDLTFLCPPELAGHIPFPRPAADCVPDWYRALPPILDLDRDDGGRAPGTVRACLPFADALALGWMLPLPFDLSVTRDDADQLVFQWADAVPFRPVALMHPGQIGGDDGIFSGDLPLKFVNPWRVVLPQGWSAAMLHPLNHFELPFTTFNAVVDCDTHAHAVDIPFRWTGSAAVLPAGTPIAQIVPFQRSLSPRAADIRAETPAETLARTAPSEYARTWHHRHQTEGT